MDNNDQIKRYLLGDLPENEAERLVERCRADEELGEVFRTAENDLIDAYVCQELSDRQRRQFEIHFLDPERRMRVDVARMLMNPEVRAKVSLDPIVGERWAPKWWSVFFSIRAGFATAALAGIALIVFLFVQNYRLHEELVSSRSAQTALQGQVDSLQRQNAQSQVQVGVAPPHPPVAVAFLMLSPALLRRPGSNTRQVMTLSPAISSVVLMLALDPSSINSATYARYDVVLETVEGRTIRTLKGLNSGHAPDGGDVVRAPFPAQLLKDGDYIATLMGRTAAEKRTELASYSFSVAR